MFYHLWLWFKTQVFCKYQEEAMVWLRNNSAVVLQICLVKCHWNKFYHILGLEIVEYNLQVFFPEHHTYQTNK